VNGIHFPLKVFQKDILDRSHNHVQEDIDNDVLERLAGEYI
jgi:hypothetical protein